MLTLHQRLNEFQNHVLHVTALMLPLSSSFGILLKTHLSDKFPELVTAVLILLSPRGSAAARPRGQGWVSAGLGAPWAPQLSPGISLAVGSRARRAMPVRLPCHRAHRGQGSPGSVGCFFTVLLGFANLSFSQTDFYPLRRVEFEKEASLQFNNTWPEFLCSVCMWLCSHLSFVLNTWCVLAALAKLSVMCFTELFDFLFSYTYTYT